VNDLAALLGLRSTAVSQQLALLRKDRIVQTRREGQTIYYSLARADVRRVIEVLYDIYCRHKQT
jgi:DNA-binding transcriptional ArsR family regulator